MAESRFEKVLKNGAFTWGLLFREKRNFAFRSFSARGSWRRAGKVIAVDLLEIALRETEKRVRELGIDNVELKLAEGYDSGIPDAAADIVFAVDMFHHVDPGPFLKEASRIAKPDGLLLISGGHQTRKSIKSAVAASGLWEIEEETRQFLKYRKRPEQALSCY